MRIVDFHLGEKWSTEKGRRSLIDFIMAVDEFNVVFTISFG